MEMDIFPLCGSCATRLGRYTDPEVPELLEGYCPQCGGTEPLIATKTKFSAEIVDFNDHWEKVRVA